LGLFYIWEKNKHLCRNWAQNKVGPMCEDI